MVALHYVQSIAVAGLRLFPPGADNKLDLSRKSLRVFPIGKRVPLVPAHDPKKPRCWKFLCQRFGGYIRVGRASLAELEIINYRPRQTGSSEPQHFTTVLAAGGCGARLVRRNRAGQETDLIERECLLGQLGEMNVPQMHGIKGAAKEANIARVGHGVRSELYRRGQT